VFESNLGHAAALKLLGRACRPFGLTIHEGLVSAVARRGYLVYNKKKKRFA